MKYYFKFSASQFLFHEFFRNPTPGNGKFVNITWPKVTPSNFQYLSINTTLEVRRDYKKKEMDKWVEVYDKFAVKPLDTF